MTVNETGDARSSRLLLFEKPVYLDEHEEFASVLIIGLDVCHRFSIGARIEVRSTGNTLHMNKCMLLEMLDNIDDLMQENAILPKNRHTKIKIQPVYETLYKISDGNKHVKLSMNALLTLRSKLPIIKIQIHQLECVNYEKQFYDLLNYFRDGNLNESDLYDLSNKMFSSSCDFERSELALEIMTNFLDWFMRCIPLYRKSLLHTHIHSHNNDTIIE